LIQWNQPEHKENDMSRELLKYHEAQQYAAELEAQARDSEAVWPEDAKAAVQAHITAAARARKCKLAGLDELAVLHDKDAEAMLEDVKKFLKEQIAEVERTTPTIDEGDDE
jgi:hypothetical protein